MHIIPKWLHPFTAQLSEDETVIEPQSSGDKPEEERRQSSSSCGEDRQGFVNRFCRPKRKKPCTNCYVLSKTCAGNESHPLQSGTSGIVAGTVGLENDQAQDKSVCPGSDGSLKKKAAASDTQSHDSIKEMPNTSTQRQSSSTVEAGGDPSQKM